MRLRISVARAPALESLFASGRELGPQHVALDPQFRMIATALSTRSFSRARISSSEPESVICSNVFSSSRNQFHGQRAVNRDARFCCSAETSP